MFTLKQLDPQACLTCQETLRNAVARPRTPCPHSSYAALRLSAEQGCNLCRLFRQAIVYEYANPVQSEAQISLEARDSTAFERRLGNLFVIPEGTSGVELEVLYDAPSDLIRTSSLCLNLEDLVSLIQLWVTGCLESHQTCHKPGQITKEEMYGPAVALPTRVVDTGVQGRDGHWSNPRLHISGASERGTYTALSYQWGVKSHSCRTTESNLPEFMEGIPWGIIPKTMQEAITITRKLGVRYVWIDALCIVQAHNGSDGDWRREAERVGSYYENALVTLSAVDALNCHEGFLMPRPDHTYPIHDTHISLQDASGQEHRYLCHLPKPYFTAEISHSKLQRRGWVVQERLFSSRMVHFGRRFVTWECHAHQAPDWDPTGMDLDSQEGADESSASYKIQSWISRPREEMFDDGWTSFIEYYSAAQLSYQSDRLVAISALVKALEAAYNPKPRYLAGLWEESMPLSLAWVANRLPSEIPESIPGGRFPSWSWASHDRVRFWVYKGTVEKVARLEDTACFENDVIRLRLRSIVKPLSLLRKYLDLRDVRLDRWDASDPDAGKIIETNKEIYSLAMICSGEEKFQGLILERTEGITTRSDQITEYRRVGLLEHNFYNEDPKKWNLRFLLDADWTTFNLI